jgi:proton-coupled amino acid transporter
MQTTKSNDGDQADVVANHLPSGYTAEFDGASRHAADGENSKRSESERESSLKLMGGDVHRDLFKLTARGRLQQRAATFSHPQGTGSSELEGDGGDGSPYPTASEQIQPGGFRREYILQNASRLDNVRIPGTRNFVEFLDLYGNFAGEDLAESESGGESGVDEEQQEAEAEGERRPLLGRRKSSKAIKKGDAGTLKTFFTLIKAFVGTGIMFLPKAFSNGGILFSSITMLIISAASALAFHLLLQCKKYHGGGYGELGGIISGPKFRALILGSITLSQLGFVCAGIVFVAENMMSFLGMLSLRYLPLSW